MPDAELLERFVKSRPLCVMARCVLGHLLTPELDEVFAESRQRQYEKDIKFSALATAVADVALCCCKNFNQAYRRHRELLAASSAAYYGKLGRVEPSVAEGVVRYAGEKTAELCRALGAEPAPALPGYKCSALDGNHLSKTEKRLKPLRGLASAALPGTVVAKYNLDEGVFERAYLLEDAHAQESSVLDRVAADLGPGELLVADRHYCIVEFLQRTAAKGAAFVIRQHGRLRGETLGERVSIGRTATGEVFEQALRISDGRGGEAMTVRRVTIALDKPTRDGDLEVHLLSNVPADHADATALADLYLERWGIENAFHVLTMTLTCEVKSVAKPRAALFLFAMAMTAYNARQAVYAALKCRHDAADVEAMSGLVVALETAEPMDGLVTALPEEEWDELVAPNVAHRAGFLVALAERVDVRARRKSVRRPSKPPPKQKPLSRRTPHVSTFRLLQTKAKRC